MNDSAIEAEIQSPSRRIFLLTAPAAAAVGLALADAALRPAPAEAQAATAGAQGAPAPFQLFTAEKLESDIKALQAAPANSTIVDGKNFVVMLTVETGKSAKEFEWHESRDHVFQVLDGSTVYEIGGTPKGSHSTRPGEWLAPESEGAAKLTVHKGDMLVIPRGTPHRRSTEGTVTLLLISPISAAKP